MSLTVVSIQTAIGERHMNDKYDVEVVVTNDGGIPLVRIEEAESTVSLSIDQWEAVAEAVSTGLQVIGRCKTGA